MKLYFINAETTEKISALYEEWQKNNPNFIVNSVELYQINGLTLLVQFVLLEG